jgi:phosphohistidine phosphatase SixA
MPISQKAAAVRAMRRIYDPSALCSALLREGHTVERCDHTFAAVRLVLAAYAPGADADRYVALIQDTGAACTCEFQLNTCARLGV